LRKRIQIGLRISIAIAAYLFIAVKIGLSGIAKILDVVVSSFSSDNLLWFVLVIALMPMVWALEAVKWREAISSFTRITFVRSWRSVWYGVVAGQLTPNRIGEPVGRLALIDEEVRGKAGVAAVLCSFTQQITTVLFGLIGIGWWVWGKGFSLLPAAIPLWIAFLVIGLCVGIMFWGLFYTKSITHWVERIGWVKKILSGESIEFNFCCSTLILVQLLSICRYLVFSTQYVILLKLFGVNASLIDLYAVVGLTYLFSSFIPSFSVGEVGVKAGFIIWFVGMVSSNVAGATAASFVLWMLNLAVPALIAAWFKWRGERISEK